MDSASSYIADGGSPDLLYYEHVRTVRWRQQFQNDEFWQEPCEDDHGRKCQCQIQ